MLERFFIYGGLCANPHKQPEPDLGSNFLRPIQSERAA